MFSSRRQRLFAASLTVALAILALAPGGPAQATTTGDGVTIELISPLAGQTLSGTVEVTYRVTAPADDTWLWSAEAWYAGKSVAIDLRGRDCSAGCLETATFDTATSPLPVNSNDVPFHTDGSHTVAASVNRGGVWFSDSVNVVIDNKRPVVTIVDQGSGYLTAGDSLMVKAQPQVRAGGTVTGVYWVSGTTQTLMTAPLVPGGAWTKVIDTSSAGNGIGSGVVRATDDRGIQNYSTPVRYVVDHGAALTAPTMPSPVIDDDLNAVALSYTWGRSALMPETTLRRLVTQVDGVTTNEDTDAYSLNQTPGKVRALSMVRVPPGPHLMTYILSDSRGATSRIDVPVTVQRSLSATWTQGADAAVLPGTSLPLEVSISSSHDTLWLWEMRVDGVGVASHGPCSSQCPSVMTAATSYLFSTPGVHDVSLTIYPLNGWSDTFHTSVTVLPRATGRITSTGATTYGVARVVRGVVITGDGTPAAGAPSALQQLVGPDWHTVGTATSGPHGEVAFTVTPRSTTSYRIVTDDAPGRWGGGPGPAVALSAQVRVVITSSPKTVRKNQWFTIKGRFDGPAKQPLNIEMLGRKRHWDVIQRARSGAQGIVTWRIRLSKPGTAEIRATRPSGGGFLPASSAPVRLRVL